MAKRGNKWTKGHVALRAAVKKYGKTAVEEKCGVECRQTLWLYLHGQRKQPGVDLAIRLRDAYEIPIDHWLVDVEYEADGV